MDNNDFVMDYGGMQLYRHTITEELVILFFIPRGPDSQMNEIVEREIIKRRLFRYYQLKEFIFTPTHMGVIMECDTQEHFRRFLSDGRSPTFKILMHIDDYEIVDELGSGSFGVTMLCRYKYTKELVAIKFIERGPEIDENAEREILNHRLLRHPNVVRFKEVILTPTHLALVMEYASGGELFKKISSQTRPCTEDEARYFFQQLICGLHYIHSMQICHRDLKLDNILLDGSSIPRLKICDFGYSKSSMLYSKPNTMVGSTTNATQAQVDLTKGQYDGKLYPLHSTPNTTVGSPTYAAPEVLMEGPYDGKMADVWSCGVTLYIMLVAAYPFEDPKDHKNFQKTRKRIMDVHYEIPDNIHISQDCRDLLSRIFVRNPSRRISLKEIKSHPWFLKNLPWELTELIQKLFYYKTENPAFCRPIVEEIIGIVREARKELPPSSTTFMGYRPKSEEDDEKEVEEEEEEDDEEELEEEEEKEKAEEEEEKDDEAEVEEEEEKEDE